MKPKKIEKMAATHPTAKQSLLDLSTVIQLQSE
jgi:hypothetical protein